MYKASTLCLNTLCLLICLPHPHLSLFSVSHIPDWPATHCVAKDDPELRLCLHVLRTGTVGVYHQGLLYTVMGSRWALCP